jgi:hypothetical protein
MSGLSLVRKTETVPPVSRNRGRLGVVCFGSAGGKRAVVKWDAFASANGNESESDYDCEDEDDPELDCDYDCDHDHATDRGCERDGGGRKGFCGLGYNGGSVPAAGSGGQQCGAR